jgi:TolA-binding protein
MTNASDDSPSTGKESSDASIDYQNLGQTLLSQELERHAYALRESFVAASTAVERGDRLDADDVSELEEQLRQAQFLVEELREAVDDG